MTILQRIISYSLLTLMMLIPVTTQAASLSLIGKDQPQQIANVKEQFYVDVFLDADEQSINGVEGSITYTKPILDFVRIEDAGTIVGAWIDYPKEQEGVISFGGIIPNGFNGLIDPFKSEQRKPGKLFRIIFQAKYPGAAAIATQGVIAAKNDGQGTIAPLPETLFAIQISTTESENLYTVTDTVPPIVHALRVKDKLLYDGKWTLLFEAIDQESGVTSIEVREGNGAWHEATSPYLVQDQSGRSILKVRAIDHAGNSTVVDVSGSKQMLLDAFIVLLLVIILIVWQRALKRYAKN